MSFERVKHLDLYELFQIDKNADETSIKRAYRRLARSVHPDKQSQQNGDTVHLFHQLNDSLEVLTNEKYRKEYDLLWAARQRRQEESDARDKRTRTLKEELEKKEASYDLIKSKKTEEREELIKKLQEEARIMLEEE